MKRCATIRSRDIFKLGRKELGAKNFAKKFVKAGAHIWRIIAILSAEAARNLPVRAALPFTMHRAAQAPYPGE